MAQIDYMVLKRYPDGHVPAEKFKIQFARMGDPAFNMDVINVINDLTTRFHAPGLRFCISTVAPQGTGRFFGKLLELKKNSTARFQMQFSLHSTDQMTRDRLIPVSKWNFETMARFGGQFHVAGDRKIALNFALAEGIPVDIDILRRFFDPEIFLIKLTPVNPTLSAVENGLVNALPDDWAESDINDLIASLRRYFEVIVSIGENEENQIGSNCGQFVHLYLNRDGSGYSTEAIHDSV
jgi:23S rRNA (adenine2503-C2)-methyltransferase